MGVHLEGPGEVITYFINPKTILIFGAIEIVVCLIGMLYVMFFKKDHKKDKEEKDEFEKMMNACVLKRHKDLEKMNGTIDQTFQPFTQDLNESGECYVGVDPLDEMDWTQVNLKMEDEYQYHDDSYDSMDFSRSSMSSGSFKRGKRWGIKRLLKANKSSQMGTIKEEQSPLDNSSFMALDTIQSTSDQLSSIHVPNSPGLTGFKDSTGSTSDHQSIQNYTESPGLIRRMASTESTSDEQRSSLQSSPGSSGWTRSTGSTSDQQSSSTQSSPGWTKLKDSTESTSDQQNLQRSPGSTWSTISSGSTGCSGSTVEIADDLIDLELPPKKAVEMAGKESLNGSCVNPQLQVKQVNKEHLDNGQINAGFLDDE